MCRQVISVNEDLPFTRSQMLNFVKALPVVCGKQLQNDFDATNIDILPRFIWKLNKKISSGETPIYDLIQFPTEFVNISKNEKEDNYFGEFALYPYILTPLCKYNFILMFFFQRILSELHGMKTLLLKN